MSEQHDPTGKGLGDAPLVPGYQRVPADPSQSTPPDALRDRRPRELLLAQAEFGWLKDYQHRAPTPRLDLRYHAEGAVALLGSTPALRDLWLHSARQALLEHLQQGSATGDKTTSGTGSAASSGGREGAQARTQGQASGLDRSSPACRALQVGDATFNALKSLQDTTPDPRVGMRYLLEGAVRVLRQRTDLHGDWVSHARRALQSHLAHLGQTARSQQKVDQSL